MSQTSLLKPREVDGVLRYPRGRTLRLIREGKIAHVVLPDGEIRVTQDTLDQIINPAAADQQAVVEGMSHV